MDKKVKVLVSLGILFLLIVGFYIISYAITKTTGYTITGKIVYSIEEQIQIANCLTNKGVVLYCSPLSLNCVRQKSTLGDAFEYISYVDCADSSNSNECRDLNLPTWKISERFYTGIRDLGKLAETTGCNMR